MPFIWIRAKASWWNETETDKWCITSIGRRSGYYSPNDYNERDADMEVYTKWNSMFGDNLSVVTTN